MLYSPQAQCSLRFTSRCCSICLVTMCNHICYLDLLRIPIRHTYSSNYISCPYVYTLPCLPPVPGTSPVILSPSWAHVITRQAWVRDGPKAHCSLHWSQCSQLDYTGKAYTSTIPKVRGRVWWVSKFNWQRVRLSKAHAHSHVIPKVTWLRVVLDQLT